MLAVLLARALRRGLWEGSRPWMVVGVVAGLVRLLSRDDEPQVVHCERLTEGQTLSVTVRGAR